MLLTFFDVFLEVINFLIAKALDNAEIGVIMVKTMWYSKVWSRNLKKSQANITKVNK